VPLISQQARGLSFPHQTKILNLGDIDHEEFYGAEPAQRTSQALERGRLTTRTTVTELGLEDGGSSCPTIEDIEAAPENGEIRIGGRLVYPVQEVNNVGNDKPGQWIERIEARKRNQEGALVTGMDFTVEDDGTFAWSGAPDLLPEEAIVLVAVLKDGSEVVGEVDQITVTIAPPRIIVYELQGGVTEATDTFEASAGPDGTYRYEWNFGDGSAAVVDTPAAGQPSRISHTFTNLKDGDSFSPEVRLFPDGQASGGHLASDSIGISVVEEQSVPIFKSVSISFAGDHVFNNSSQPNTFGDIAVPPSELDFSSSFFGDLQWIGGSFSLKRSTHEEKSSYDTEISGQVSEDGLSLISLNYKSSYRLSGADDKPITILNYEHNISNVVFSGTNIWGSDIYVCSGADVESRINVSWYSYRKGTSMLDAGHEFEYLRTNSTPAPVLTIEFRR
jgi:hypothetical protein